MTAYAGIRGNMRTKTNPNKLHLVVGHGPNGPVITTHNKKPAVDCITMTRSDYHAFLFCMRHIFHVIAGSASGEKIIRIGDVVKNIALFLYADIAKRVAPELSEHEQLELTVHALYSSNITMPRAYFAVQQLASFNPTRFRIPRRNFFVMHVVQRITASSSTW